MKIRIKSLWGLSIISLIVSFSLSAISATTKTCPAGLFCTSGGKYTFDKKNDDIQAYQMKPAELVVDGWGMHSDEGICDSCGQKKSLLAYIVQMSMTRCGQVCFLGITL